MFGPAGLTDADFRSVYIFTMTINFITLIVKKKKILIDRPDF